MEAGIADENRTVQGWEQPLEEARTLARSDRKKEALLILKRLDLAYPKNAEIQIEHATVLFWSGRVKEAEKLMEHARRLDPSGAKPEGYDQIKSAALFLDANETLNSAPKRTLALIDAQPPEVRDGYDLALLRIQAYIRLHRLEAAENAARGFAARYPQSAEAGMTYAQILFWLERYDESIALYERLARTHRDGEIAVWLAKVRKAREALWYRTDKPRLIAELEMQYAHHPDPVTTRKLAALYRDTGKKEQALQMYKTICAAQPCDLVVASEYIEIQMDTHRRADAHRTLKTLGESGETKLALSRPELYRKALSYSVEGGAEAFSYSDDRYDDWRTWLQGTMPIDEYIVLAAVETIARYDMEDRNFRGEWYAGFENKLWGYLSFSFAPNPDFMPLYGLGIHLYQGFDGVQAGLGVEWNHYEESDTLIGVPEYTWYPGGEWYWTQKFYLVPDSGSYAFSSQIGQELETRWKWTFAYIYSSSKDPVETLDLLKDTRAHKIFAEWEYRISHSWGVGVNASFERDETEGNRFDRKGGSIRIKRYW